MFRHVLIVDDEPTFLRSLALYLEDAGHRVQAVSDAGLALEGLHASLPDAIVCDLRMPGMGGLEFLTEVRKNPEWRQIPFILLTGAMEPSLVGHPAEHGIYRTLGKPFDPEELLAILRNDGNRAS